MWPQITIQEEAETQKDSKTDGRIRPKKEKNNEYKGLSPIKNETQKIILCLNYI